MKLAEAASTFIPRIEDELRSLLEVRAPAAAKHYEIMQYHMGWRDPELKPAKAPSGKRLRPLLCVLTCMDASGDPSQALPAAAGLELLHNFSLVHDDIEDSSSTRRHRPTAWSLWGVPVACNVGDGMFSLAHLAFLRLLDRGVSQSAVLSALRSFIEMNLALTEGQYQDMSFEARLQVSVEDYYTMIGGKTGALLSAASEIGAIIAGATDNSLRNYREYGAALGRAFQLQDDILGIWGDEQETGKSTANDILSKKKTLPVVIALNHPDVGKRMRALYAGPRFDPDDVPAVLSLLDIAGARQATELAVKEATARGHAALQRLGDGGGYGTHDLLIELLDTLVSRRS